MQCCNSNNQIYSSLECTFILPASETMIKLWQIPLFLLCNTSHLILLMCFLRRQQTEGCHVTPHRVFIFIWHFPLLCTSQPHLIFAWVSLRNLLIPCWCSATTTGFCRKQETRKRFPDSTQQLYERSTSSRMKIKWCYCCWWRVRNPHIFLEFLVNIVLYHSAQHLKNTGSSFKYKR